MTNTPKIIMPHDKKVVPIMPPPSDEEIEQAKRTEKAKRAYEVGNQALSFIVANTETPVEAIGILQMLSTRLAMGLNADLWTQAKED